MIEYISKEAVLQTLQKANIGGYITERLLQPVNQWISVKDRFPDEDGWYLVCKHNRVRVAEWCKDCWYNESDLPIDDCAITYWKPLPEPPKDGEHIDEEKDMKLITDIMSQICNYAIENDMKPTETLKTVANNILMITEISNFDGWGSKDGEPK